MKILMIESKDFKEPIMERLQEIKSRYNAISSAPWVWFLAQNTEEGPIVEITSVKPGYVGNGKKVATLEGDDAYSNADFICKVQEDLVYLVTVLESLMNLINSAIPKTEEETETENVK
jgi:hypothetical protein